MQIQVTGIHIDVGEALRTYVHDKLVERVGKYFERPVDAQTTFAKEGHQYQCDCSVHLSSGMTLNTTAQAGDIYASFDAATERLEKRLRRYKRRLKDHHNHHKSVLPALDTPVFVISSDSSRDITGAEENQPVIIAEGITRIPTLSVSDAVMQMDISDSSFVVFKASDGGVNLVYRRQDGNIGWIDTNRDSQQG